MGQFPSCLTTIQAVEMIFGRRKKPYELPVEAAFIHQKENFRTSFAAAWPSFFNHFGKLFLKFLHSFGGIG